MAVIDIYGSQAFEVSCKPAPLDVSDKRTLGAVVRRFPFGWAWVREAGWLPEISRGIAKFLSRFVRRYEAMERQIDPRTADELLDEWEQMLDVDVPDGTSIDDRRLNVLTALRSTGGTTAAYYESVALSFGYVAVVTNAASPFVCTSPCTQALMGGEWKLVFLVTTPSQGPVRDSLLEDLINNQKLAGWGVVYDFT
jgi:uncharacterized protein YmfQ (DUF2313 family)